MLSNSYDVVIIGGAMVGSSIAWHLMTNPDFNGSVLVVEKDPSYEFCSTAHTNSCIRMQFSVPTNIEMSMYGAEFIKNFQNLMEHEDAPALHIQDYGYLYLAGTAEAADNLRQSAALQNKMGAGTRLMSPDEIAAEYPYFNLDGVVLGSHGTKDEGQFDGPTIFQWFRKRARDLGAVYAHDEVVAIARDGRRVTGVTLASGQEVSAGQIVNAAGPRGAKVAAMAGLSLPVEPRRRYTYIFSAEDQITPTMPLTIDPAGMHMRPEGANFLCGCPPFEDVTMAADDFSEEPGIWEEKLWPGIANRVPAFERIRVLNSWVGHYAYNTFDQNALLGPMDEVENFIFANGFSGHGLQQSPATGRGIAEWITHGAWQSLDLSALSVTRVAKNQPCREANII